MDYYTLYTMVPTWAAVLGTLLAIAVYVLGALGLYTLTKNRDLPFAWFAWIPFLRGYLLGQLINDRVWGFGGARWILLFGSFVLSLLANLAIVFDWPMWTVSLIGAVSLVLTVYIISANYKLFRMYRPESAMVITIIGIFVPVLYSIWYFVIRNDRVVNTLD